MSVKRFIGVNSRDAMRQVRAALGDDALVLSNRNVHEGVEILAMADNEHGQMIGRQDEATHSPPESSRPTSASPVAQVTASARSTPKDTRRAETGFRAEADFAAFSQRVLGEMQDLRTLLTGQMQNVSAASRDSENSTLARLQRRLLGAGFGVRLVQELLEAPPVELIHAADEMALDWSRRQLAARLPVLEDEAALLDEGGVFALVGPTGVGKTTTTAKLAARYVMRHGADGVALVTTDSYRIGAHEQLRIYARLLGVEVHALEADAPLDGLIAHLAHKRLIIIDTVGMSQRDQRLAGQIAMLGEEPSGRRSARPIRRLLLLNAASHGDTLDEVVDTYQRASRAAGAPLFGAILTKLDEAPRLGAVMDIAIRHGLRLHYVSHGQQVPEDLDLANREALLDQALSAPGDSSFAAQPPASSGSSSSRRMQSLSRGLLGQGRALVTALATLRNEIAGFALLEQAWSLLGYPLERQQALLTALLDAGSRRQHLDGKESTHALLWSPARPVAGVDWAMPVLCLNEAGQMQALPWLAHRLPTGEEARLDWARSCLKVRWQLMNRCPGAATRRYLAESDSTWLATVQAGSRIVTGGEHHTLAQAKATAAPWTELTCRYRGRDAHLALSHLPGTLADGEPVTAWFGTLSEADSSRQLARRYWLAPRDGTPNQAFAEALVAQLVHDDLPVLTRRAWQCLEEIGPRLDPELRLLVASALASVASRLDQERSDWAMDVRALLLGLLGGRRARSPSVLLDALLHLLTARDVFVMVGGDGLAEQGAW
ncbi:flagellar biosynthesis protein FlhF [Modicisalibacter ilicicola DSM 19980]|uniref:Flagellar biosynthesis protein FlhF n=1 Tax=Modicisalibacter ilicicola DSM 19980 TaxID=1121942 RepID=A0A1M5CLY6_9GAMM|nr:flagellar biosynthesis protein FlhF [Halomonas ilicicola]SHF55597.1 flagellar biosynthesis protein FlhF [Halomonas ilicicola DSM 19980]